MESYCGKNCVQCAYGSQIRCPGCRWSPGAPGTTLCPIARCCQEKGHESCHTCTFKTGCNLWGRRESFPFRPAPQQQTPSWYRSSPPPQPVPPSPPCPLPTAEAANILGKWTGWRFFLELLQIGWAFLVVAIPIKSLSETASVILLTLSTTFACLSYFQLVKVQFGYLIPGCFRLTIFPLNLAAVFLSDNRRWGDQVDILLILCCLLYFLVEWTEALQNKQAIAGLNPGLSKCWNGFSWALLLIGAIALLGILLGSVDYSTGVSLLGCAILCFGAAMILKLVFLCQTVNALTKYLSRLEKAETSSWRRN